MLHQSWQALEAERNKFEILILACNSSQQKFFPAPGAWNMLQVYQHVMVIEKATIEFLVSRSLSKERRREGWQDKIRVFFFRLILKSPLKFNVPPVQGIMPTEEPRLEGIMKNWNYVRDQLKIFLEDFPEYRLKELIFRHPVVGWLTIEQTINFFTDHIKHHQHQLKRIRNSPGFPAGSYTVLTD